MDEKGIGALCVALAVAVYVVLLEVVSRVVSKRFAVSVQRYDG